MSRSTLIAAGVVVALAAAYPASSWYLGKMIEDVHTEQLQKHIATVPYLKVIKNEYTRNLFDATQVVTIEFPAGMFGPALLPEAAQTPPVAEGEAPAAEVPPAPPAAPAKPIQITFTSHIKHGPFPGFSAFGAGLSDTQISFDAETQKKVDAVFGGKPALTGHTLFNMSGGGHSTIKSPAFRYTAPKSPGEEEKPQVTFAGEGLDVNMDFDRALANYSLQGGAPRFEISDTDGAKIFFSGFKLDATQRRLFDDEPLLYVGKQRFSLAEINFDAGKEDKKFLAKNIVYDLDVPVTGDFIDVIAKIGADELKVAEKNYGPAHYDFSVRHIGARKFAALYRKFMEIYKTMPAHAQDAADFDAFTPLIEPAKSILADTPVFSIDRLSFQLPDGEAAASANLKINNFVKEDLDNPLALLAKLEVAAEFSAPETALSLLDSVSTDDEEEKELKKQAAEEALASYLEQGYIVKDGKIIKSKIEFRSGQLTVNGKVVNLF